MDASNVGKSGNGYRYGYRRRLLPSIVLPASIVGLLSCLGFLGTTIGAKQELAFIGVFILGGATLFSLEATLQFIVDRNGYERSLVEAREYSKKLANSTGVWIWLFPLAWSIVFLLQVPVDGLFPPVVNDISTRYGTSSAFGNYLLEPWRLLTPSVVHAHVVHVAANIFFFWMFAKPLNLLVGRHVLPLVFLTGAFSSIGLRGWLEPFDGNVGSSGGIYAMMASSLVIGLWNLKILPRRYWYRALFLSSLTVVPESLTGFVNPGHIGGFIGGVLISIVLCIKTSGAVAASRITVLRRLGATLGLLSILAAAQVSVTLVRQIISI